MTSTCRRRSVGCRCSPGWAIAGLAADPSTAAVADAARAALTDGARTAAWTATAFLVLGLLASLRLHSGPSQREVEAVRWFR